MMRILLLFGFLFGLSLSAASVFAQSRDPKIGYVYPAGGQRGTTVEVMIGGRQIARADGVLVSGQDVTGTVVAGYTSMWLNNTDERVFIRRLFQDARLRLLLGPDVVPETDNSGNISNNMEETPAEEPQPFYTLEQMSHKYPYVDKLVNPTAFDLQRIFYEYFHVRPDRMPKEAFAQGVLVRLTIAPNAQPGDRELRLLTPAGVTAPIRFVIGTFPEVLEIEPNDTDVPNLAEWMPDSFTNSPNNESIQRLTAAQREELMRRMRERNRNLLTMDVLTLPVVINGQIRSGDVDRFQFRAEKGQKIVIAMQARYLIPYLADAVPGWFQGMLTLYGPGGRELVSASSYRFEPDPLICFEMPESDTYTLEIRDTLFRGRDDFVYRVSIGEMPFVTSVFPLGGQVGTQVDINLQGWNLPATAVRFDTAPDGPPIREFHALNDQPLLRPIRYAVDHLPEIIAPESAKTPVPVTVPIIVNGRIMTATGIDSYQFTGRRGETIVCDVSARSLNSSLDAALELFAPDGTLLAQCDDRADSKGPNIGLETHHADPYLRTTLPADGTYTIRIYNTQQRGGPEYAYRLRITPPQLGFTVYCIPSTITFFAPTQPITFHAVRHDGFDGNITITAPDAPFQLSGATIPSGTDRITATLTAMPRFDGKPQTLTLRATGQVNNRERTTSVTACDDHEQAFIYHHLVPTLSLTVMRGAQRVGGRALEAIRLAQPEPLRLIPGGDGTTLNINAPNVAAIKDRISFVLLNPPEGIALLHSETTNEGWKLTFHATESVTSGTGNILISIEVRTNPTSSNLVSAGTLPAIPYVVIDVNGNPVDQNENE